MCRGDEVITDSGVFLDEWDLAQPGNDTRVTLSLFKCSIQDFTNRHINGFIFPPKGVVKVGVERCVRAIATEERYDVRPGESAAASKSKYGCQLLEQTP